MEEQDKSIDIINNSDSSQKGEPIDNPGTSDPIDGSDRPYADKPNVPQPVAEEKPFPGIVKEEDVFEDAKKKKKSKGHSLFKSILVIIVVWVFFAVAGGAYIWRDNQAKNTEAEKDSQIANLQASLKEAQGKLATYAAGANTCTVKAPSAATIESIKASITSSNTGALEGYMASSVTTVLAASEEGGSYTPAQAVSNITAFIADATSPWDFNLTASILSSYGKGSYAQYFPGSAVIGKSANKKVIAFSFDCNAKIKTVFMSVSEDVLN